MLIDYASELERKAATLTERASLLGEAGKHAEAKALIAEAGRLRREAATRRARRTAWHPRRTLLGD